MIDRAIPMISIGLSHREAPVDVRSTLALSYDEIVSALRRWNELGIAGLLLATCQRTELHLPRGANVAAAIDAAFRHTAPHALRHALAHMHTRLGGDAVRHLLRVAAGLDSTAIGETEILGQVRRAVQQAREADAMDALSHRIADVALLTGKRVRRETHLARHARSLVARGLDEAARRLAGLTDRRVLVVGTGHMAKLVLRALRLSGAREVVVTGRTPAHVVSVAQQHLAITAPWSTLPALIGEVDLVVCATATTAPVITTSMLAGACARRSVARFRWPVFIDLAVPRGIEHRENDPYSAHVIDLDLFASLDREPGEAQHADITRAELIVEEELERLHQWWRARENHVQGVTAVRGTRAAS